MLDNPWWENFEVQEVAPDTPKPGYRVLEAHENTPPVPRPEPVYWREVTYDVVPDHMRCPETKDYGPSIRVQCSFVDGHEGYHFADGSNDFGISCRWNSLEG